MASVEQIVAGPQDRLWVTTVRDSEPVTRLTDFAGRPVPATSGPSSYRGLDNLVEDRRGGLITIGVGGAYQLTPNGPRRITRGTIVAMGAQHFLTSDCTATLRCSRYLVERGTLDRRRVGPAPINDYADGSLSADGRYAALWSWSRGGEETLSVTDLDTGATLARYQDRLWSGNSQSLVWLPDNRLLGVRSGRIFLFDPATRRRTTPDLGVRSVEQIALRTARR